MEDALAAPTSRRKIARPNPTVSARSAVAITAGLSGAEVLSMAGTMSFPALIPLFTDLWGLSATQAGWIGGIYQAGYAVGVPILVAGTDRMDPRRIYVGCCFLAAAAQLGFAVFAGDFWSALGFRFAGGIALAGTYMPGLKALTDAIPDHPRRSRHQSFYTATFAVGTGTSVLLAGLLTDWLDWRWAFGLSALGPLVAAFLMVWSVPRWTAPDRAPATALLDFRPVLGNRAAMGYILGYAAHCWELFGFRAWLVTFLTFSASFAAMPASGSALATIAAVMLVLGLPASILGNEVAMRFGRRRFIVVAMLVSAVVGCGIGFTAAWPFWIVVGLFALYAMTITWDSASLTVGAIDAAPPASRGATMAVHALLGFVAASAAPIAVGAVIDGAGGTSSGLAWGLGFAVLGFGVALGPLALGLLRPRRAPLSRGR